MHSEYIVSNSRKGSIIVHSNIILVVGKLMNGK